MPPTYGYAVDDQGPLAGTAQSAWITAGDPFAYRAEAAKDTSNMQTSMWTETNVLGSVAAGSGHSAKASLFTTHRSDAEYYQLDGPQEEADDSSYTVMTPPPPPFSLHASIEELLEGEEDGDLGDYMEEALSFTTDEQIRHGLESRSRKVNERMRDEREDVARHEWLAWWPAGDANTTPRENNHWFIQTKMAHRAGEGLLVDPGAHDDLTGDRWVARFAEEARLASKPLPRPYELEDAVSVGGVGAGRQQSQKGVVCELGVDGKPWKFSAPVLQDSDVPALLGVRSLKQRRCVMDCFTGRLYTMGAGGYKMALSPGSQMVKLHAAHSGHWILPCTDWAAKASSSHLSAAADALKTSPAVSPSGDGAAVE